MATHSMSVESHAVNTLLRRVGLPSIAPYTLRRRTLVMPEHS